VQHLTGRFRLIGDVPPLTGVPEADDEEARTVRMEHARARYGDDFSDKHLVQETGLLHAVHFRKGCYLGQEIVERVKSRGQVHKLLRLVELDTHDAPAIGAKLTSGGQEAGEVVSSAYSPALDKTLAMAYMRPPQADTGTAIELDGVSGRVRSLPQA
jgi:aminomethyltransferase